MARHTAKSHKIRKVEILVIQIRNLSIILGNIQTLNEILEEAEKQEAKNESTRLENLKKEVEGIILN